MRVDPIDLQPGHKGQPYKGTAQQQRRKESGEIHASGRAAGFFATLRMTDFFW
jgi:hypothetical protein